MVSVFNMEPNNIKEPYKVSDYRYTFLDNSMSKYNIKYSVYYKLINSLETFKLLNIYQFIYIRLFKLNRKFDSVDMILKKERITPEEFDIIMNKYIHNDLLKSIIIMNSIQLYFFPKITNIN